MSIPTAGPVYTRSDTMAPEGADRLAAVLDLPRSFRSGDELPLLWHWAYFPDIVRQSELGTDGHLRRLDDMAARFPRRMFASAVVRRHGPLLVGRPAQEASYLEDIVEKQGRSGPVAFAHWRHAVGQDGQLVLEERQTVAYRAVVAPGGSGGAVRAGPAGSPPPHGPCRRSLTFDSAVLFRFSAVTWNAHRIHYDWPYATESEGYPGLVVHGPLLALILALDAAQDIGELDEVDFRAQAPVFVGDRVDIFGQGNGRGSFAAEARRFDGVVAMSLTAGARP
jgi:3-methylfumaryl-CoA hydratase